MTVIAQGSLQGLAAATADQAPKGNDTERLRAAACEFEALLMAQMLKSMQASGMSRLGEDEAGKENDALMDMASECFAKALAAGGGLGIAKIVVSGVEDR